MSKRIAFHWLPGLFLLLMTQGLMPLDALAKDPMAGRWKTVHTNAHGTWTFVWEISEGETYTSNVTGPTPMPGELGTIKWGNGNWSINATTGRTDSGTYRFDDANTMTTNTSNGPATWARLDNFDNPLPGKGATLLQSGPQAIRRSDGQNSATLGTASGGAPGATTGNSKFGNAVQNLKNKVNSVVPGTVQKALPSLLNSGGSGNGSSGSGIAPTLPAAGGHRMPWQKPGGGYVTDSKWK